MRQSFRNLAFLLTIAMAAITCGYWWQLETSFATARQKAVADHERLALQMVVMLSNHIDELILGIDNHVRNLADAFPHNKPGFEQEVRSLLRSYPQGAIAQIGVIGEDGYLQYSNLATGNNRIYLGDREHFTAHLGGTDRLFISKPVLGRVSKLWTIQLSRPILHQGKLLGVVVVSLSADYLSKVLERDIPDEDENVGGLVRRDGIFLARSVKADSHVGTPVRNDRPFIGEHAPSSGTLWDISSKENIRRLYAWQRTSNPELIAVVALGEKNILLPINENIANSRLRNAIGSALILLGIGAILYLLNYTRRQQQQMHAVLSTMASGVFMVDEDGAISMWNESAKTILGVDAKGIQNRTTSLIYPNGQTVAADDYPSMRAYRDEAVLNQEIYGVKQSNGGTVWISVNSRQLPYSHSGKQQGAVISFSNITRLIEAEASLRISHTVFDVAGESIMVTDENNHIIAANPAFTKLTGYTLDEVLDQTPGLLSSGYHDEDFFRAMHESLHSKGSWEGEIVNRRKDGSTFVEWLKIAVVRNEQGQVRNYVSLFSDITAKKNKEEQIWHQANFDTLTGLPNRILLQDRLQQATVRAGRNRERVGLLFIDLDRFKPVNDQYGHQAGDNLLQQVAQRLQLCVREEDTVARLGGDEFVVLLPAVQQTQDALWVAEKVLRTLMQPFRLGEPVVDIAASIGIALFPDHANTPAGLLDCADHAMYRAKESGRHTIRVYNAAEDAPPPAGP